jgi:hypothetical protein
MNCTPEIIYDANANPVRVVLPYDDWKQIEARLGSLPDVQGVTENNHRIGGWAKGKIIVSSDFDDPMPGLEDYT